LGVRLTLPIFYTLAITIFISAVIFWIGGKVSPKSKPSEEKLLPYAGGERVEHELVPVSIKLFDYALLFIVFDVISLMLFFSIGPVKGTVNVLGAFLYTLIVMLAFYYFARRF